MVVIYSYFQRNINSKVQHKRSYLFIYHQITSQSYLICVYVVTIYFHCDFLDYFCFLYVTLPSFSSGSSEVLCPSCLLISFQLCTFAFEVPYALLLIFFIKLIFNIFQRITNFYHPIQ
jgi:hypothetical protein